MKTKDGLSFFSRIPFDNVHRGFRTEHGRRTLHERHTKRTGVRTNIRILFWV